MSSLTTQQRVAYMAVATLAAQLFPLDPNLAEALIHLSGAPFFAEPCSDAALEAEGWRRLQLLAGATKPDDREKVRKILEDALAFFDKGGQLLKAGTN